MRTAPHPYTCKWCGGVIHAGQQYVRRNEHNGIHYTANKYHPECAQARIEESKNVAIQAANR